jgi:hypothetical protein
MERISLREEYVLLRFIGGGLPESQFLLHKNGHSYDEITFKDSASGEESTLYFKVDIPIKHGVCVTYKTRFNDLTAGL